MRYDLYSLTLFATVAATGSIAGAATRHNTVASAVSKRISDLEQVVGAPLFLRQRRGVELTSAGQTLLVHAQTLQRAVQAMEADMGGHTDGSRGTIRVAANTSSITQFLPEDLAAFMQIYPDLRVQLIEQTSADILDAVQSGFAELGIYSGFSDAANLTTTLYRRDTLVVAAAPDHWLARRDAVSFHDLLGEDFVALQQGSSIQAYLERRAEDAGHRIRTRVEVMSFDAVRRMVQARLGIAILPRGAVEPYAGDTQLVMIPIAEPWAERELRIAVRDEALLTRQARALLQFLAAS